MCFFPASQCSIPPPTAVPASGTFAFPPSTPTRAAPGPACSGAVADAAQSAVVGSALVVVVPVAVALSAVAAVGVAGAAAADGVDVGGDGSSVGMV